MLFNLPSAGSSSSSELRMREKKPQQKLDLKQISDFIFKVFLQSLPSLVKCFASLIPQFETLYGPTFIYGTL